ncbi:hypothetical protein M0812_21410 [Anaeramoeba flamelloides]|uniref:Uncharacterized protein n=1 Tax=Anaeramoeba flamelloides TaxID=1746091 RepID=A0AAV7YUI9_9EUKA|nr:hypothetical protein M0812_21410 [Anaeramoeba flamelloides]
MLLSMQCQSLRMVEIHDIDFENHFFKGLGDPIADSRSKRWGYETYDMSDSDYKKRIGYSHLVGLIPAGVLILILFVFIIWYFAVYKRNLKPLNEYPKSLKKGIKSFLICTLISSLFFYVVAMVIEIEFHADIILALKHHDNGIKDITGDRETFLERYNIYINDDELKISESIIESETYAEDEIGWVRSQTNFRNYFSYFIIGFTFLFWVICKSFEFYVFSSQTLTFLVRLWETKQNQTNQTKTKQNKTKPHNTISKYY